MKEEFVTIKISKDDFKKLNEEDLMFITNPGRMGDEDGSTFIIKNNNEFKIYRVSGWMYGKNRDNEITIQDMFEKFPLWEECWHNWNEENYSGKYVYIYMGFGNGLCVDKRIYEEFYPYLLEEVKNHKMYEGNEVDYNPSLNYSAWKDAFIRYSKK